MKKLMMWALLCLTGAIHAQTTCGDTIRLTVSDQGGGLVFLGVNSSFLQPNLITFGDGFSGDYFVNQYHLYTGNGTYNICLTVYDTINNCTSYHCETVTITDAVSDPCAVTYQAFFYDSTTLFFQPFYSSQSMIGNQVWWDFDNGQTFSGGDSAAIISFLPGTYHVCIQNTNPVLGCSNTYCDSLIITNAYCPFDVSMQVEQELDVVRLSFSSEYQLVQPWTIDYGNGFTGGTHEYRYTAPGTYIIQAQMVDWYNFWPCDLILTDTVVIDTVVNPCSHDIQMEKISNTGYYHFTTSNITTFNSDYSNYTYRWNTGAGYFIGDTYIYNVSFDSVGLHTVCNIAASNTGCTDTACVNIMVDVVPSDTCAIGPAEKIRIYKDNSTSLFYFKTTTTPLYMPASLTSGAFGVSVQAGQSPEMWYWFAGNNTTTYTLNAETDAHCTSTSQTTFNPSGYSHFNCDSILQDIQYTDKGNGLFRITPVFNPYVGAHTQAFRPYYIINYNINGYTFKDASLGGIYIQLPYAGNFSGSAYAGSDIIGCEGEKKYFSLPNTEAETPGLCDAYFTLEEDTTAILPNTYILNNLSTGNNLSYLWYFGDGDSSMAETPSHTYATTGFYEITLTITDTIDGCTDTYFSEAKSGYFINTIKPGGENPSYPAYSIYPNPASNLAFINGLQAGDYSVEITDMSGKAILVMFNTPRINLEYMASGIYIATIRQGGQVQSLKFIRQ